LDKITIRVPATTANLGPGFDCLGMALELYNTVEVEPAPRFDLAVTGEGEGSLSRGEDNLVCQAMARLCSEGGSSLPPVRILCRNSVPLGSGLGSSSAAIVGGLLAANAMLGDRAPQSELLHIATAMEGHPDNVAPAILGGCQIVVLGDGRLVTSAIPLPPGLRVALFIPSFQMPTKEARAILSPSVTRKDAVFNIGRTALLVNALQTGRLDLLKVATQDRLHQPQRLSIFPAMNAIIEAALEAGALGAFLSGAGPTVAAFVTNSGESVAKTMEEAARVKNVTGRSLVVRPALRGAHRVEE